MPAELLDSRLLLLLGVLLSLAIFVSFVFRPRHRNLKSIRKKRKAHSADVVRQSDNPRMNLQQRMSRERAEKLIAEGKVVEGARILESIGLDRQAIAVLEGDGFVDEACAMLLRMQRFERAAIIYQRNNYFLEAAAHYLHCDRPIEAAECYLSAGKLRKVYLKHAARIFERENEISQALRAYHLQKNFKAFIDVCERFSRHDALCEMVVNPRDVKRLVKVVDESVLKQIVGKLPVSTGTANWLSLVVNMKPSTELCFEVTRALLADNEAVNLFWAQLSSRAITSFCMSIQIEVAEKSREVLFASGCALMARGNYLDAAILFGACKEWTGVALCYVADGAMTEAIEACSSYLDPSLSHELVSRLESGSAADRVFVLEKLRGLFFTGHATSQSSQRVEKAS